MDQLSYSSEEDGILEPSLCIDSKAVANFSVTDTPSNGHEYLFSVISEARKCPKTVVARLKSDQLDKKQTIYIGDDKLPRIPDNMLPSESWKSEQLYDFIELRRQISSIEPSVQHKHQVETELGDKSSEEWLNYLYNESGRPRVPLVSLLCSLDQVGLMDLICHHVSWVEEEKVKLNVEVCRWLYSILVCLETPLDPDSCDSIRSLSRLVWATRHRLHSEGNLEVTTLNSFNLLICLIGLYFGQADLAD